MWYSALCGEGKCQLYWRFEALNIEQAYDYALARHKEFYPRCPYVTVDVAFSARQEDKRSPERAATRQILPNILPNT
ncbi:hypothetical protein H0W91_04040 [Patescibacteria group bacterium]|nr:hypothetical protein [Patescibacteria group bacterium]